MTKSANETMQKITARRYYIRSPRVETIIAAACNRNDCSRRDVLAGARNMMRNIVRAREEICVELRNQNWSLPRIGRTLCLHHTTVRTALIRAGAQAPKGRVIWDCEIKVPDESGIWAI